MCMEASTSAWQQLQPHVSWHYQRFRTAANSKLEGLEPWQVASMTAVALFALLLLWRVLGSFFDNVQERGQLSSLAPVPHFQYQMPSCKRDVLTCMLLLQD